MKEKSYEMPSSQMIEDELNRLRYRKRYRSVLRSTVYTLISVAAVAVLVATLLMPVLQIFGSSMSPTLEDGEIVLSLKTSDFEHGDVVAFYYNNKILVKRVIAVSGEWVDISPEGDVFVNSKQLDEPYISEKSLGDCNIELPYQVPESRIFVMGDHRSFPLTPVILPSAVLQRSRLLESWCSGFGRWMPWNKLTKIIFKFFIGKE